MDGRGEHHDVGLRHPFRPWLTFDTRNVQRRRWKRTSSEQEQEAKQEVLHEI